jgi:hypothetical protein
MTKAWGWSLQCGLTTHPEDINVTFQIEFVDFVKFHSLVIDARSNIYIYIYILYIYKEREREGSII